MAKQTLMNKYTEIEANILKIHRDISNHINWHVENINPRLAGGGAKGPPPVVFRK